MPVYQSDRPENVRLVREMLVSNVDKDNILGNLYEECFEVADKIVAIVTDPDPYVRSSLEGHVIENAAKLAAWKACAIDNKAWTTFLHTMRQRGIPTNSINRIKRVVEDEFELLL